MEAPVASVDFRCSELGPLSGSIPVSPGAIASSGGGFPDAPAVTASGVA